MNVKNLFKGVNTNNIDINKIEQLDKELPVFNPNVEVLKKMYDSFYEKNKSKLFKEFFKISFNKLPLVELIYIPPNKDNKRRNYIIFYSDLNIDNVEKYFISIDDIKEYLDVEVNNYTLNNNRKYIIKNPMQKTKEKRKYGFTTSHIREVRIKSFRVPKKSKRRFLSKKSHIYDNLRYY